MENLPGTPRSTTTGNPKTTTPENPGETTTGNHMAGLPGTPRTTTPGTPKMSSTSRDIIIFSPDIDISSSLYEYSLSKS